MRLLVKDHRPAGDEAAPCLAEIAAIPGHIELSTRGDLNVRQGVLYLQRGDPNRAIQLLTEAARCFSIERMRLAHGFCLTYLSVAQRRAGDLDTSLRIALEAREILGNTFGPSCEAEVAVGLAAAYLALGRNEDALVELEAMPASDQIRPQTRIHSLVLRAMAASAAAPSAAAAFLLSQASEFADGHEEQTMLLVRAAQEIAYRAAAYETSALLLGVLARIGSDTHEIEVGLPVFESSRLQRHLPQSGLETMIADGFNVDPKAAFGLAVTMLTELASQVRVPLPPRPVPDNSVTFGTRFMLIAPHSPSVASHRSGTTCGNHRANYPRHLRASLGMVFTVQVHEDRSSVSHQVGDDFQRHAFAQVTVDIGDL